MRSRGSTARAAIVAAVEDGADLPLIQDELHRRYGLDYDIRCTASGDQAGAELAALRAEDLPVALVLGDSWGSLEGGGSFFEVASDLHPLAKRVLLIDWGAWREPSTSAAVLEAMETARIDYYAIKPRTSPDEDLHRLLTELLQEWSRAHAPAASEATLIGEKGTKRLYELEALLAGSGVPYHLEEAAPNAKPPVLVVRDGRILSDPTNAEVAEAFGVETGLGSEREFDLVVIGAGPSGLTAAVYGSSEALSTLVVDRAGVGGQAGTSSLIRNYLGFSRGISGGELAQRAYQQAWVFGTRFALMREARVLRRESGRWVVGLDGGDEAIASAVVLATGVAYRRLGVQSLERLVGSGVFYGASVAEAKTQVGGRVFVVGGGNSAGQAAMHLARYAAEVTVVVRGQRLGETMSDYLEKELAATGNISVRLDTEVVGGGGEGKLQDLELRVRSTGEVDCVPASGLFVLIGAEPSTGWLPSEIERDADGYLLTGGDLMRGGTLPAGWPLERAPLGMETSAPGVFAIGDVRHGSTKRVASGAGEGSVVVSELHRLFAGGRLAWRGRPD